MAEGSRELLKDQTLRKAELFPNLDEDIGGRGLIAMCKLFQDQFQAEVVPERDEIANAVAAHFAAAREQLSELQLLLIRLPGKPHPASLTRLEKALESCRRDRRVEPTLKALKRNLVDLRDGLTELRRLRTDVTEEIVAQLGRAADFRSIYLEQLRAEASAGRLEPSALEPHQSALEEHLRSDRPWEGASALGEHVTALQGLYVGAA